MGTKQALKICRTGSLAWLFAIVVVLASALAFAQDVAPSSETRQEDTGFFAAIGRWFSQQSANVNSTFKDARQKVEGLGQDAGAAASWVHADQRGPLGREEAPADVITQRPRGADRRLIDLGYHALEVYPDGTRTRERRSRVHRCILPG